MLRRAGSNWVTGDRFFDRQRELVALEGRVRDGVHTLLTAQRRMGKTSLVRELFRRLEENGEYVPILVDLKAAIRPEDSVAEIGTQCRQLGDRTWARVRRAFGSLAGKVDEVSVATLKIKLRSELDAENWTSRGDALFNILATSEKPTVLALDELPLIVSAMLNADDSRSKSAWLADTRQFLGWLRKNGQAHQGRVTMIVLGSVSLQPILRGAGLSAFANIFTPLGLRPWSDNVAQACLAELAKADRISIPSSVRHAICRRLRCCVPHHVQQFYFYLRELLDWEGRHEADLDDVERVYRDEMLGMSGQVDLSHYETRLNAVLGPSKYWLARELLTLVCRHDGILPAGSVNEWVRSLGGLHANPEDDVRDVLHLLEHDGYLAREGGGYRFVSGLLEDWWRKGHLFMSP